MQLHIVCARGAQTSGFPSMASRKAAKLQGKQPHRRLRGAQTRPALLSIHRCDSRVSSRASQRTRLHCPRPPVAAARRAGARFSPESARPREGSALMIMMSAQDMYGSREYGREQHLGACRNRDQRAEHRVLAPQRNGVSRGALESLSYVLRFITEVSSLPPNIEGSRRRAAIAQLREVVLSTGTLKLWCG